MSEGIILGEDTVYEVITRFPELKETLISASPNFIRLQNPVLFNTVARITTLKKAAIMGKLYLNELLYNLNEAIGKREEFLKFKKAMIKDGKEAFLKERFNKLAVDKGRPSWAPFIRDFEVLDARGLEGDPFLKVTALTSSLENGHGLTLIQNFQPLPLITWHEQKGFQTWTEQEEQDVFKVHFFKP